MSFYTQGIGADIGGTNLADSQLASYNSALQKDLVAVARGFPVTFVAADAERLLKAAVDYGKKQLSRHKKTLADWALSIIGRPINTHGLELAIEAAETGAKAWHGRASETYVYTQNKNKEWLDLNGRVMKVYVEVAGLVGEHVSLNSAKAELKKDIDPTSPTNVGKYVLIGGGAYLIYRLLTGPKQQHITLSEI